MHRAAPQSRRRNSIQSPSSELARRTYHGIGGGGGGGGGLTSLVPCELPSWSAKAWGGWKAKSNVTTIVTVSSINLTLLTIVSFEAIKYSIHLMPAGITIA